VAGYGDKTTPKSVKLARDFGDGVEGGSSLSDKCWDSPPETLRAGDAWPMIIQRSTSCARYDSRLLEILRSLKPWKLLRRLQTKDRGRASDGRFNQSERREERRGGYEPDNVAARPGPRFCRCG
jgi:hypothetical protein